MDFTFQYRIPYADTDKMGVVYYANYLKLFEQGRTELLRNLGFRYRDMEEKDKVFLPVSEASCHYFSPAKYDDLIEIKTNISEMKGAHINFLYEIFDAETKVKIAVGFTKHPFVNEQWKPVHPPKWLKEKIGKFLNL